MFFRGVRCLMRIFFGLLYFFFLILKRVYKGSVNIFFVLLDFSFRIKFFFFLNIWFGLI